MFVLPPLALYLPLCPSSHPPPLCALQSLPLSCESVLLGELLVSGLLNNPERLTVGEMCCY